MLALVPIQGQRQALRWGHEGDTVTGVRGEASISPGVRVFTIFAHLLGLVLVVGALKVLVSGPVHAGGVRLQVPALYLYGALALAVGLATLAFHSTRFLAASGLVAPVYCWHEDGKVYVGTWWDKVGGRGQMVIPGDRPVVRCRPARGHARIHGHAIVNDWKVTVGRESLAFSTPYELRKRDVSAFEGALLERIEFLSTQVWGASASESAGVEPPSDFRLS